MKKYFKISFNYFLSTLNLNTMIILTIIFFTIFFTKNNIFIFGTNFIEDINIIFKIPISITENFIEFLLWLFYEFYLVYIIGSYLYKSFTENSLYIISRIGSKKKWFICLELCCFFVCFFYYLISMIMSIILLLFLSPHITLNDVIYALNIIINLTLCSYFIINIYLLLLLLIKNHSITLLFVLLILIFSVCFNNVNNVFISINKLLIENNPFIYIYIFLAISTLIMFCNYILKKNDLLKIIN